MINFKTQSIDGYGDRDDIALERDKQQGVIVDNIRQNFLDIELAVDAACEWGSSSSAIPLSTIVREMIENEVWERLIFKSQIIFDTESISEALTEACIQLGLSDEDFTPNYQDKGSQIDLRLF